MTLVRGMESKEVESTGGSMVCPRPLSAAFRSSFVLVTPASGRSPHKHLTCSPSPGTCRRLRTLAWYISLPTFSVLQSYLLLLPSSSYFSFSTFCFSICFTFLSFVSSFSHCSLLKGIACLACDLQAMVHTSLSSCSRRFYADWNGYCPPFSKGDGVCGV